MYYYGARYYDPRISIFVSVDPLAEDFVGWTPYHYVHQNPINLIDPTGMSAENSDGGGWLSKAWNSTKNEVKSWFGGSKPNYEVIVGEPEQIGWDYGESVPCIECHHNTTATNGEKIGDLVGGSGGMIFSGQGYESFGGWEDIPGKPKVTNSTDWSSYSFGKPSMLKEAFDGFSKGVSIGEDKNVQSWFKPKKNNDPKPMDSLFYTKFLPIGNMGLYEKIDSMSTNTSPNSIEGKRLESANSRVRDIYKIYLKDSVKYKNVR